MSEKNRTTKEVRMPPIRICAGLSDWESIKILALKIIAECGERRVLIPRSIEWIRDRNPAFTPDGFSIFRIGRDGIVTQWTMSDWDIERLPDDWMDLIADRLVATLSARAGDPPVDWANDIKVPARFYHECLEDCEAIMGTTDLVGLIEEEVRRGASKP